MSACVYLQMPDFSFPFASINHECTVDNYCLYFPSHEIVSKNLIRKKIKVLSWLSLIFPIYGGKGITLKQWQKNKNTTRCIASVPVLRAFSASWPHANWSESKNPTSGVREREYGNRSTRTEVREQEYGNGSTATRSREWEYGNRSTGTGVREQEYGNKSTGTLATQGNNNKQFSDI